MALLGNLAARKKDYSLLRSQELSPQFVSGFTDGEGSFALRVLAPLRIKMKASTIVVFFFFSPSPLPAFALPPKGRAAVFTPIFGGPPPKNGEVLQRRRQGVRR